MRGVEGDIRVRLMALTNQQYLAKSSAPECGSQPLHSAPTPVKPWSNPANARTMRM